MTDLLIVMAHYNNPNGLIQSLKSIDEDFAIDIAIIDDGSTLLFDESKVLKVYTQGNIYFLYQDKNKGVGEAANRGLVLAQQKGYKYIGRFDCGDICHKGKYKTQLTYLDENPEIKLISTWARVLDMEGNYLYKYTFPLTYEEIKKNIYINSTFLNPSAVFKTEILDKVGLYEHKYRHAAQDYAFFFKVVKHYKCINLSITGIDYIIDPNSISSSKRRLQLKNRIKIILEHFYFGYYPILGLTKASISYMFPRKTIIKAKEMVHKIKNGSNKS